MLPSSALPPGWAGEFSCPYMVKLGPQMIVFYMCRQHILEIINLLSSLGSMWVSRHHCFIVWGHVSCFCNMVLLLSKPAWFAVKQTCFLILIFLNWRIIVLQCCGGFCHISMQISHSYIYIHTHTHISPPIWASLSPSLPSHPSLQSARLGLPILYRSFMVAFYFTHGSTYMSRLPFSTCVSQSFHADRVVSTIFLDSIYMH